MGCRLEAIAGRRCELSPGWALSGAPLVEAQAVRRASRPFVSRTLSRLTSRKRWKRAPDVTSPTGALIQWPTPGAEGSLSPVQARVPREEPLLATCDNLVARSAMA